MNNSKSYSIAVIIVAGLLIFGATALVGNVEKWIGGEPATTTETPSDTTKAPTTSTTPTTTTTAPVTTTTAPVTTTTAPVTTTPPTPPECPHAEHTSRVNATCLSCNAFVSHVSGEVQYKYIAGNIHSLFRECTICDYEVGSVESNCYYRNSVCVECGHECHHLNGFIQGSCLDCDFYDENELPVDCQHNDVSDEMGDGSTNEICVVNIFCNDCGKVVRVEKRAHVLGNNNICVICTNEITN